MPRDDWKKGNDRDVARRANQEFAQFGRFISYESVFTDLGQDELGTALVVPAVSSLLIWLNGIRVASGDLGSDTPEFTRLPREGEETAIPFLIQSLYKPTPDTIKRAAAVARLIGPKAANALTRLPAAAHGLTSSAVKVLGRMGKKAISAIPYLENAVLVGSKKLWVSATEALDRLNKCRPVPKIDTNTNDPNLLLDGLSSSNPSVRRAAVARLRTIGAVAVPAIVDQLTSGTPERQAAAAFALGELGSAALATLGLLQHALKSQDSFLRHNACHAIAQLRLVKKSRKRAKENSRADDEKAKDKGSAARKKGPGQYR